MDIPPEVVIKASIRLGSVYYFPYEKFHSDESHFFVVVNVNPNAEEIVLVAASSKINAVKKRNKKNPPETLIEINPNEYPDFTCSSILDCNYSVIVQKIDVLVERLSSKKLKLKSEMDVKFVERLRQGILVSKLVSSNIKGQLK